MSGPPLVPALPDDDQQDPIIMASAGGEAGSSQAASSSSRPTYSKRGKITIVACVPCRKRKTKCDGLRPSCSQCASRRQPCFYDMTDDQRKLTHLRENVEHLQEKTDSLESLLHTVQTASEEEATEVYRRLRSGQSLRVVADQVQASHLLSGVSLSPGKPDRPPSDPSAAGSFVSQDQLGGRHLDFERLVHVLARSGLDVAMGIVQRLQNQEELSSILRDTRHSPAYRVIPQAAPGGSDTTLEHNFSRGDQAFGMFRGTEVLPSLIVASKAPEFTIDSIRQPWTTVTSNPELVEHLVELYFTWQHSFFQSFPEKLFRTDMKAGRTKYCSAMLVNAICACGCFLSDRQDVRTATQDGKTLMDMFYEESRQQLHVDERSNLTTVATLCLLSYIEGTKGRITSLWVQTGRSALMATDINLHLKRALPPTNDARKAQERANEHKARTHAFWGSFHSDATSAFTLGRLPNYNVNGVTVELPVVDSDEDEENWSAYGMEIPNRACARSSTFLYCATLSELINSTLLMFFAPTSSLSGSMLMAQYEKYREWWKHLPEILKITDQCPPHVLSLHMYYHSAVLLLFRPFLKAKIVQNPDVVPRDICRQSANEISSLFALHWQLFGPSGIHMFQVHCLLTACTIHIINLPTISATREFTAACEHLHALIERNAWARSSLLILRGLVRKWSLILPQEAEAALYKELPSNSDDAQAQSADALFGGDTQTPDFALPTDPSTIYDMPGQSSVASSQQTPDDGSSITPSNLDPALMQSSQSPRKRQRTMASSSGDAMPVAGPALRPPEQAQQRQVGQVKAADFLYSPLANQPAPFLVPVRSQRRPGVVPRQHVKHEGTPSGRTSGERDDEADREAGGVSGVVEADAGELSDDTRVPSGPSGRRRVPRPPDAEATEGNLGVEGMSFGDDWRDPFLGFLPF